MAQMFDSLRKKVIEGGRRLEIGSHRFTGVYALDEPGPGGASHEYAIAWEQEQGVAGNVIVFQKGPVKEAGVNGCFMEDLIAICIDRLEAFQAGDFACVENAMAADSLKSALFSLDIRTKDRQERGVEGHSAP